MSKDIWHKAGFREAIEDKLKVSKDGKWVYWSMYGWNIAGEDAHDTGCEWAYLDDLLALETELDRTRKALDVTVDALKVYANQENWDCEHFYSLDTYDIANEALEQITALTKGDNNE